MIYFVSFSVTMIFEFLSPHIHHLVMSQVCGLNHRALAMKKWDQFHQSGKESVRMMGIVASIATGQIPLSPSVLCFSCMDKFSVISSNMNFIP